MLIQVGDTQLLLGVTPGRIQTLHRLTKPLVSLAEKSERNQRGVFPRLMETAFKRSAAKMARQS
jgi:flagellar protein FliO/FliZ